MKYLLVISILFLSLSNNAQNTVEMQKAKQLIESDYLSVLQGINELKSEIRKTSDRMILNELKTAQQGLIKDYIEGPYAIFESNAIVETALLNGSDKSSTDKTKAFLVNYGGKDYSNIKIDVERVEPIAGKADWYEVYFSSFGEVSNSSAQRKAIVSKGSNKNYQIRRIGYVHDHIKNDLTTTNTAAVAEVKAEPKPTSIKKESNKSIPVIEETVPVIVTSPPTMMASGEIHISGYIVNSKNDGFLTANYEDIFVPGLQYNISQNSFNLIFKPETSMNQQKSMEVEFTYKYDDRFIKARKNIVLFPIPNLAVQAQKRSSDIAQKMEE